MRTLILGVLLLSLGEDQAAAVLQYLDESNVRQLSECIEAMQPVSRTQAAINIDSGSLPASAAASATDGGSRR